MRYKLGVLAVLSCIALAGLQLLAPAPAYAEYVSLSNRYIELRIGKGDPVKGGEGTDQKETQTAGCWGVMSQEGDPEVTGDNRVPLILTANGSPLYPWGLFKVRVGDQTRVMGDDKAAGCYWIKQPTVYSPALPGLGLGKGGPFIECEWNTDAKVNVRLKVHASLVRDQVRFEMTLTNTSTLRQSVAFEMFGDTLVESTDRAGIPFLPGIGFVRVQGLTDKPYGLTLTGDKIPEFLECFGNAEDPEVVTRHTLKGQDCVPPDYVAVGEWGILCEGTWLYDPLSAYNPDPMDTIDDLSCLLCWSPVSLAPGGTRKIVTYFGMGAASTKCSYSTAKTVVPDSAALAVQGPRVLKYDSTTNGLTDLDPAQFTIKGYLYNLATDPGPYNLEDVTMSIYLPPGLQLATGTAQQEIGRVPINSESVPVSWDVRATGDYCGELEYFVTARDNVSGWQQSVSRKILVPATKKSIFRYGWQLVSVPFTFNNLAIDHVFGLRPGSFNAQYFNPTTNSSFPVTKLQPGRGFWMYVGGMKVGQSQPFGVASDAAIVGEQLGKQVRTSSIQLGAGWNLVGNPLVYPIYWGQVQVYDKGTNTIVSLDKAVANNWLSKTIFSWNSDKWAYESANKNTDMLIPWKAYWVRAKMPVTLYFPPGAYPGSDVTARPGGI